ncbi:MAG: ATP-dependent DNA helicase RecG [Campylobacterota bacterium]|nr:ATP-dependent DNA helicase RecG [Campylobacterota bacterium]
MSLLEDIEKADQTKFQKLGVSSYTQLALLIPHKFEDHRINTVLIEGAEQVIDATVEYISQTPKTLQLTLFSHNFGYKIEAVFFRPKPYMMRQFLQGERYYLFGMITCKAGRCQMSHPQKITAIGEIIPKYKTALRTDVMARLIKKYLTCKALENEGIPEGISKNLIALHVSSENQDTYALKFAELYDYMKALENKRRYFKATQQLNSDWKAWSQTLPFRLTDEQVSTIKAIQNDFSKDVSAKRMIVGDVGSGKTMVILASALMAQPHKVILMAPTTILANQLFEEAQKFLPNIKSVLVTNTTKKAPLDEFNFIIGTHALLYRKLPKAALVMIDEQHRFGTAQRNKLDKMLREDDSHPHVLQFSATPIPRTQAMIDSAHIDVSLITQTPFKKDITSKVIGKSDFPDLLQHIKDEIAQKHQVLLVYPLVEQSEAINYQSIEEARGYWEKNFDKVAVTHGKDKDKEEVLLNFRDEGDILIATTVVEVGISLPRLSTVIIVGAERLGLSTLHQLRGRVSRNGLKGYCYLFTHQKSSERLEKFVTTTNGFDIAALDLKFRQSGDLLRGNSQSGKRFAYIDMGEDENIVRDVKEHLLTCKA